MATKYVPAVPQALEDARALVLILANEEAALAAQIRAAATDRRAKDFAELLMAQQSLPARKAEAERVHVAEELSYAERRREKLLAERAEATAKIEEAVEREQAARQEVAMAQGRRESATGELGTLGAKIKDLSWKANQLGIAAPAALEGVMA